MKITMAEAINLKSILISKITELNNRRKNVSTIRIPEKNAEYINPLYNVDDVTNELNDISADSSKLTEILAIANVENVLEFRGEQVTLSYALDIVKRLRAELSELKKLGNRSKEEFSSGGYSGEASYVIALYEPEVYAQKAEILEREINKLSILINSSNYSIKVEVPFAEKYLS